MCICPRTHVRVCAGLRQQGCACLLGGRVCVRGPARVPEVVCRDGRVSQSAAPPAPPDLLVLYHPGVLAGAGGLAGRRPLHRSNRCQIYFKW